MHLPLEGRLTTDAITAAYSATLAGVGIAAFTWNTVRPALARGHLVHVLPGCTLGKRFYYALYPHTRHVAPKVRAFCRLHERALPRALAGIRRAASTRNQTFPIRPTAAGRYIRSRVEL